MEPLRGGKNTHRTSRTVDGLVGTKLITPPLKSKMIERTHLLDRLSESKGARLIAVSGVAGSGKTSLASQWVQRERVKTAWYSLDKADNDPHLFCRYVLASLSLADDRLASLITADLREGKTFGESDLAFQIVRYASDFPEDIYLVLDDYHLVTVRSIHETIAELLRRMPSNMHLIIITRYSIPFPLSSLRVRNEITEILASDLRFTEKETERFFAEMMPVSLTASESHEVARQMEGWVGGLQLLGLSLRGRDAPQGLSEVLGKGNRQAWDYLMDEVITMQPRKVRIFLEATAPLDRFTAELATELTGMPDSRQILDTVYRNNLFLVPLDSKHEWYRYHHLLSETVRERTKVLSPEKLPRLHRQAALWFSRKGFLEDAFRNAFASGDFDFAADLLEDYLLFQNDRYEFNSMQRWLPKLPVNIFMERMLLRLHDAGMKFETFQTEDVGALVRDIERDRENAFSRYSGHKKRLCEDLFNYASLVLHHFYRDPAHADLKQLEMAVRTLFPENKICSAWVVILTALQHIFQGNPVRADALLHENAPAVISGGGAWARTMSFRVSATAQRVQGRLHRSEDVLRQAFEFLKDNDLSDTPLRYILFLPMAWIHHNRNELDDAFKYATGGTAYAERVGFLRDVAEGNLLLALIHLASGRLKEARKCLRKVDLVTKQNGVSEVSVSADPWLARMSMIDGDTRKANEWSHRTDFSLTDRYSSRMIHETMTRVELLYRQELYEEAETLLSGLRSRCIERNMMEAVLDIDVAEAGILRACGRHSEARGIMEKALSFAEEEGYVRPFCGSAFVIFPLLHGIQATNTGFQVSAVLDAILHWWSAGHAHTRTSTRHPDGNRGKELTGRELEVMRLLAAGHTYKEMAYELSVSMDTVRTHMRHIFDKLGVNSRTKAVNCARNLRLLTD